MAHLEFDRDNLRYSLTGKVITVFDCHGKTLCQRFYPSHDEAVKVFMMLY